MFLANSIIESIVLVESSKKTTQSPFKLALIHFAFAYFMLPELIFFKQLEHLNFNYITIKKLIKVTLIGNISKKTLAGFNIF